MGTINYMTSDYITMGIKPESYYDYTQDPVTMEEMKELAEEWNCTIDEAIYQTIADNIEADMDNTIYELDKHNFYYFHIAIKPGYYEGFSLDIENNFPIAFDNYREKAEAQKEITEIKSMLKELAGNGLVACYPGWCMKYDDHKGTLKAIDEAIKEMRSEVKTTPTWNQYERG